jgi:DNA-binding beta-propeller fold protein YncE
MNDRPRGFLLAIAALAASLLISASPSFAAAPNHPFRYQVKTFLIKPGPPPVFESFEGPCGLAVDPGEAGGDPGGRVYVSNYYHDRIDVFESSGEFLSRFSGVEPLDGPCGLALGPGGELFANGYHQNVTRYLPLRWPPQQYLQLYEAGSGQLLDTAHPTGVAVEPVSDDLYVDERSSIAVYAPPYSVASEPSERIGLGSLGDAYGVAVSEYPPTAGDVYVADAATGRVKVYDPGVSLVTPSAEIDGAGTPRGGFASLVDTSLAVDRATGHLFVADNLQSVDVEHPEVVIDEFNAEGDYRGQIARQMIDGEAEGLAVDNSRAETQGDIYVTSGNSEEGMLLAFGPTAPAHRLALTVTGAGTVASSPAGIRCPDACAAEYDEGSQVTVTAAPAAGSVFSGWSGCPAENGSQCTLTMAVDHGLSAEFTPAPPAPLASSPAAGRPIGASATLEGTGAVQAAAPAAIEQLRGRVHRTRHRHRHHGGRRR